MTISRVLLGIFCAPLLSLSLWLHKHAVDSALISAPDLVTAACGESLNISCQYSPKYRDYTKYWCRGRVYTRCEIVAKTPKGRDNDKVSIADDKEAGVFRVTMTSLTREDEDMYWCVIATKGINPHTGVRLTLADAVVTTMTTRDPTLMDPENLSWWGTLRWIVFILMLCCVATTHIVSWRMEMKKTRPCQESQNKNSNIYL